MRATSVLASALLLSLAGLCLPLTAAGRPDAAEAALSERESDQGKPGVATLSGTVVDPTGAGVDGVRVFAYHDDGDLTPLDAERAWSSSPSSATSDALGRFEIARLQPGPVRLALRKPGYAARDIEGLALAGAGRTELGSLSLSYARTVGGRVVDANGAAVEGARILALAPWRTLGNEGAGVARLLATSDLSGGFLTDELDTGTWTLIVASDAHPETRFPSVVPFGRDDRHLELRLPPAASIRGVVVTMADSDLADVVVHALPLAATDADPSVPASELLGYRSTRLDSDGSFTLEGLHAGETYSVHALPQGLPPRRLDAWSKARLVRAGASQVKLEVAHGMQVRLRALDNATDRAVTSFAVELRDGYARRQQAEDGTLRGDRGRPWTRHADGRVAIEELRPDAVGAVTLVLHAPGYVDHELTLEPLPGTTLDLEERHLTPKPTLEVLVVDAETKEPVRQARLEIVPLTVDPSEAPPVQSLSDPHGRARVEDRPGRARALGVRATGYAPLVVKSPFETRPIEEGKEGEGGDEVVVAELTRGSRAEIRVTSPGGAPLAAAPIVRESKDPDLARFSWTRAVHLTDARGVARFDGLVAGVHRFVAGRVESPAAHEWALARVDGRETIELALGSPAHARVEGVVTEAGAPLAGATVLLVPTADNQGDPESLPPHWRASTERVTRSDDNGEFRLFGLPPGSYDIYCLHPSRAQHWVATASFASGPSEYHIDLPVVVLTGTVRDVQGRPVVGAELRVPTPGRAVDVFESGTRPPPLALTDYAGGYAVRGVAPDRPLTLIAYDPATKATARAEIAAVQRQGIVPGPDLVLDRAASLRLAPDPGMVGQHALIASYQPPADPSDTSGSEADRPLTEERAVVPYTGGEAVFEGLAPGSWTLTVARLDGSGRFEETWDLVTVELVAGEERLLVPSDD